MCYLLAVVLHTARVSAWTSQQAPSTQALNGTCIQALPLLKHIR
jgi:hypothetical protein